MFHLQHRDDELIFNDLPIIIEQDLTMNQSLLELDSPQIVTKKRKRSSKSSSSSVPKEIEFDEDEKKEGKLRKTMHRDIERQRRQEMSTLYTSLRELLPLEYIKGKRSISDHMHEAVNYIKQMEKNIRELKLRKDKVKINLSSSGNGSLNIISVSLRNYVTVNCCCDGVEILINCGIKEGYGFSLSRVLVELIQTGLDIVSCISNKVNGRFLHKIQTQVNTLAYMNLPELQQRLANAMNKD